MPFTRNMFCIYRMSPPIICAGFMAFFITSEEISFSSLAILNIFTCLFILLVIWAIIPFKRQKTSDYIENSSKSTTGELAGAIIHELNQPICIIHGYLEILQMNIPPADKDNHAAIKESLEATEKLSEILENVRKFALYKGKSDKEFDVARAVENSFSFLDAQLSVHCIHREIEKNDSDQVITKGDEHYLTVAFLNLIFDVRDNLLASSPPDKTMRIYIEREPAKAVISIRGTANIDGHRFKTADQIVSTLLKGTLKADSKEIVIKLPIA